MEPVEERASSRPSGSQAIDRAAELLRYVVDAPEPVAFAELVRTSGLAKSTASRILGALERSEMLRRDDSSAYVPGAAFVRYSLRANPETDLVAAAITYLDELSELTHETVNLGVIRHGAVVQIAQIDSRYVLGGTNWLGRSEPVHCTALGKALLFAGAASLPKGRLERLTASTITSRGALERDLTTSRRRGYAVANEELEIGLIAVAAPIRRADGVAVAALSVSGPSTRLRPTQVRQVGASCARVAEKLSRTLGYQLKGKGAA